jgi:sphingolipid delta-4 desaturase
MGSQVIVESESRFSRKPTASEFTITTRRQQHDAQARALLRAHPEVRALSGPQRITSALVVLVVGLQMMLAWAVSQAPWWLVLAAAWLVGAFVTHALWVLIHECVHNLVFRKPRHNLLLLLFANLPIVIPAATPFRKYHLLHHRHLGDPDLDGDVPSVREARFIGHGFLGKSFWLFNFWIVLAMRAMKMKRPAFFDRLYVANAAIQTAFVILLWAVLGPKAVAYLSFAAILSVGLHPVGARWIQEHFMLKPEQETYSYYGILNWFLFNIGHHNEHHDAPGVPWMHLPRVRSLMPELYESLYAHRSWLMLWLRFLFDPSISLFDRLVRFSAPAFAGIASRAVPPMADRPEPAER